MYEPIQIGRKFLSDEVEFRLHSVRTNQMVKRLLQNEIAAKRKIDPRNKRSNQDCEYYIEIKTEKVEGYQSSNKRYYKGKFCTAAPKAFWRRKKNTISLPLKLDFKGSTGHSNAIPVNKDMQLHCKKEIEELGYLSYS